MYLCTYIIIRGTHLVQLQVEMYMYMQITVTRMLSYCNELSAWIKFSFPKETIRNTFHHC